MTDDFYQKALESYAGQRYALQGEAYRAGDMAAVKAFADEAHEEIIKKYGQPPTEEDWELAKEEVDQMGFPNEVGVERGTSSHQASRTETHTLKNYEIQLPRVRGCELIAYYGVCPTCNKVWHKSLTLFCSHHPTRNATSYTREFLKKGKPVEEVGNG